MFAFRELLDHLPVERRDVVGLPAADEPVIGDDFLIHPVAPAFMRSAFSDGHDVTVRPFITPASINGHRPWQIAATGLPVSKNSRMNDTALGMIRN